MNTKGELIKYLKKQMDTDNFDKGIGEAIIRKLRTVGMTSQSNRELCEKLGKKYPRNHSQIPF